MTTVILRFLFLALLVATALAVDNFQQRCIYYGESDNVCHYGGGTKDLMYLNINLDGRDLGQITG